MRAYVLVTDASFETIGCFQVWPLPKTATSILTNCLVVPCSTSPKKKSSVLNIQNKTAVCAYSYLQLLVDHVGTPLVAAVSFCPWKKKTCIRLVQTIWNPFILRYMYKISVFMRPLNNLYFLFFQQKKCVFVCLRKYVFRNLLAFR